MPKTGLGGSRRTSNITVECIDGLLELLKAAVDALESVVVPRRDEDALSFLGPRSCDATGQTRRDTARARCAPIAFGLGQGLVDGAWQVPWAVELAAGGSVPCALCSCRTETAGLGTGFPSHRSRHDGLTAGTRGLVPRSWSGGGPDASNPSITGVGAAQFSCLWGWWARNTARCGFHHREPSWPEKVIRKGPVFPFKPRIAADDDAPRSSRVRVFSGLTKHSGVRQWGSALGVPLACHAAC